LPTRSGSGVNFHEQQHSSQTFDGSRENEQARVIPSRMAMISA